MKRFFLLISVAAILMLSCKQNDIFWKIAQEVKPLQPLIKGVPTKMALFKYATTPETYGVYVASSSTLYRYVNGAWGTPSAPGGTIIDLAATTEYLYALTDPSFAESSAPELWRIGSPVSTHGWEKITLSSLGGFPHPVSIYSAADSEGKPTTDILYLCSAASGRNSYAVHTVTGSAAISVMENSGSAELTGAANAGSNNYYSTKNGVYQRGSTSQPINGVNISGMINTGTRIIALGYLGDIYDVTSATKLSSTVSEFNLRGPTAVYTSGANKLLLVAISTSQGTLYGYREIDLTSGSWAFRVPGKAAPTTVDDADRYDTTIKSKPINAIFQVPASVDPNKALFASIHGRGVAKNDTDGGLWSYRSRDGVWQWNAEE
jgi:hypothetical protein